MSSKNYEANGYNNGLDFATNMESDYVFCILREVGG